MKAKKLPDQDYLNTLFKYDGESGGLFFKISSGNKKAGDQVSNINRGYLRVNTKEGRFYAHRVIWKMVHGEEPDEIDHINGIRNDNRMKNLRSVGSYENQKNTRTPNTNTSGVMGVSWYKRDKNWRVQIRVDDKPIHIGYFKNKDEAIDARKKAEIEYGYHKNHGRK